MDTQALSGSGIAGFCVGRSEGHWYFVWENRRCVGISGDKMVRDALAFRVDVGRGPQTATFMYGVVFPRLECGGL